MPWNSTTSTNFHVWFRKRYSLHNQKTMFLAVCCLHIAISVSKMKISSHNKNILLSSGIHWHSNGFNGDSFFCFYRNESKKKTITIFTLWNTKLLYTKWIKLRKNVTPDLIYLPPLTIAISPLHIAISVGKVTISPHNRNILLSSGIHWHSNGFNGDSDFFKKRREL